jgi:hypothetical protein
MTKDLNYTTGLKINHEEGIPTNWSFGGCPGNETKGSNPFNMTEWEISQMKRGREIARKTNICLNLNISWGTIAHFKPDFLRHVAGYFCCRFEGFSATLIF